MAYTTINKSTDYFDTKVYTGNGSSQTLTMDNLGMLWIKNRTEQSNHNLFDSVRGGYYTSAPGPNLRPNSSTEGHGSDITSAYGITFGLSSSTIGSDGGGYNYNQNSKSYVGWQWRAGSSASSNTAGTINTTATSVDTTAGFSISTYTGTGSDATVGHGLGVTPKIVFFKRLDTSANWVVQSSLLGNKVQLVLNGTDAENTDSRLGASDNWSNQVFTVGTYGDMNASGGKYVAYAFAEKTGYSKFGKLISNGSDDGTFTYTGFAPKLVILKPNVTDSWSNWYMFDTARDTNLNDKPLYANLSTQEAYFGGSPATNYAQIDILSNGFKIRRDGSWGGGGSGTELLYMAFGQSIVGSNNVPCTAR
jgi:hypothetical protein